MADGMCVGIEGDEARVFTKAAQYMEGPPPAVSFERDQDERFESKSG